MAAGGPGGLRRPAYSGEEINPTVGKMPPRKVDSFAGMIEMIGDIQGWPSLRHGAMPQWYDEANSARAQRFQVFWPEIGKYLRMDKHHRLAIARPYVDEAMACSAGPLYGMTTSARQKFIDQRSKQAAARITAS